jgi:hypothetical protein
LLARRDIEVRIGTEIPIEMLAHHSTLSPRQDPNQDPNQAPNQAPEEILKIILAGGSSN